jgi:PAS domain-containing protein
MNIGSASLNNTENSQHTEQLITQLNFTTLEDPVVVYDNNLTVIKVNKAYINNFGFDPSGLSHGNLSSKFKHHFVNPLFDLEATLDALNGKLTRKDVFLTGNYLGKYNASFYPLKQNHKVSMVITIWRKIEPENARIERLFKRYDKKITDLSPIVIFINRKGYVEYANIGAHELLGATS